MRNNYARQNPCLGRQVCDVTHGPGAYVRRRVWRKHTARAMDDCESVWSIRARLRRVFVSYRLSQRASARASKRYRSREARRQLEELFPRANRRSRGSRVAVGGSCAALGCNSLARHSGQSSQRCARRSRCGAPVSAVSLAHEAHVLRSAASRACCVGQRILFRRRGDRADRTEVLSSGHSIQRVSLDGLRESLGAILIMRRIGLRSLDVVGGSTISRRKVLLENWIYGRWLVGSAILYALSTYSQMFFVAGILGLSAAGILRAMQIPSLAMTQVITEIGLLVLPSFSFDFGRGRSASLRHKSMIVSAAAGLAAAGFAVLLLIARMPIEHLVFGGRYAQYAWLIPVLALVPLLNGATMGCSMALRASQRSYFDLISNVCAAPVAVVSSVLFTRWWGIGGAAASIVLSFAVFSVVTLVFFGRLLRDQNLQLQSADAGCEMVDFK